MRGSKRRNTGGARSAPLPGTKKYRNKAKNFQSARASLSRHEWVDASFMWESTSLIAMPPRPNQLSEGHVERRGPSDCPLPRGPPRRDDPGLRLRQEGASQNNQGQHLGTEAPFLSFISDILPYVCIHRRLFIQESLPVLYNTGKAGRARTGWVIRAYDIHFFCIN